MSTECNGKQYQFQGLESRAVVADFEGGKITSDGGGLLLRELERKRGILGRFAACLDTPRISISAPIEMSGCRATT